LGRLCGFHTLQDGAGIDGLFKLQLFLPELTRELIVLALVHSQFIEHMMIGIPQKDTKHQGSDKAENDKHKAKA
jgi:hypothetical protein